MVQLFRVTAGGSREGACDETLERGSESEGEREREGLAPGQEQGEERERERKRDQVSTRVAVISCKGEGGWRRGRRMTGGAMEARLGGRDVAKVHGRKREAEAEKERATWG
eukprot:4447158-Pleurochrysis_carterae.AAC.1